MHILITNDDGAGAPGLAALAQAIDRAGHQAAVVAPERECSAIGHGITVHSPLRVEEVQVRGLSIPAWAVSGTPADCVKLAVDALLPWRPELTISGINFGPNLGTDVLYSGTVSAAVESIIAGVPGIAVSLACQDGITPDYSVATAVTTRLVEQLGGRLSPEMLLNVNVPCLPAERIAGILPATLGRRRYTNAIHRRTDPRGRVYYWLAGEVEDAGDEQSDVAALRAGYITVTPLHIDLTDYRTLQEVREWGMENLPLLP